MYQIIDSRGSGKTSRLMLLAKENQAKFVCANPLAMRQKAYAYGITGIDFVPYSDLFNGSIDPKESVVIDELEVLVQAYTDGKMIGYTLSKEE